MPEGVRSAVLFVVVCRRQIFDPQITRSESKPVLHVVDFVVGIAQVQGHFGFPHLVVDSQGHGIGIDAFIAVRSAAVGVEHIQPHPCFPVFRPMAQIQILAELPAVPEGKGQAVLVFPGLGPFGHKVDIAPYGAVGSHAVQECPRPFQYFHPVQAFHPRIEPGSHPVEAIEGNILLGGFEAPDIPGLGSPGQSLVRSRSIVGDHIIDTGCLPVLDHLFRKGGHVEGRGHHIPLAQGAVIRRPGRIAPGDFIRCLRFCRNFHRFCLRFFIPVHRHRAVIELVGGHGPCHSGQCLETQGPEDGPGQFFRYAFSHHKNSYLFILLTGRQNGCWYGCRRLPAGRYC